MEETLITSLSTRGQLVIPRKIRDSLHLLEGQKFSVRGRKDIIVLKKLEAPSLKGLDKLFAEEAEKR